MNAAFHMLSNSLLNDTTIICLIYIEHKLLKGMVNISFINTGAIKSIDTWTYSQQNIGPILFCVQEGVGVGGVVSINCSGNKILKGFLQLLLRKEQTATSVSTTDKCCAGIRFLLLQTFFQYTLHQCSSKILVPQTPYKFSQILRPPLLKIISTTRFLMHNWQTAGWSSLVYSIKTIPTHLASLCFSNKIWNEHKCYNTIPIFLSDRHFAN
jgi:hypothetical protein